MNPYAVLMLARTMELDRSRAAERKRIQHADPHEPREARPTWAEVARFPRPAAASSKG